MTELKKSYNTTYAGADITAVLYFNDFLQKIIQIKKEIEDTSNELQKLDSSESFDVYEAIKVKDTLNELIKTEQEKIKELNEMNLYPLGTLHTVSYSTFREKIAVRALGITSVKSYTRGPRTIAGTMIFTLFNQFELDQIAQRLEKIYGKMALLDQLPPFNLMLVFSNEYGQNSTMHLIDVEFNTEGQSQSIVDLTVDRSLNFYCKEIVPMRVQVPLFNSYSDLFNKEKEYLMSEIRGLATEKEPERTFRSIISNPNEEIREFLDTSRRTTI